MPVYNCESYVADALESIIQQTYNNLEIIVVDDCSTDRSWEIIQAFAQKDRRIKVSRNSQNLKIRASRNIALFKSSGKYIANMDGDDRRELTSIAKQVDYLESRPEVVIVGGAAEFCNEKMQRLNDRHYPTTDIDIRRKIFRYAPFCHACVMIRKSALEETPYQYDVAEDYDLYFRLGQVGKMANFDSVIYHVRTRRNSVSLSKTRYIEKMTLYIRIKATMEYDYKMSFADKLYFVAQFMTMYFMPAQFRFWLFNKLRSRIL